MQGLPVTPLPSGAQATPRRHPSIVSAAPARIRDQARACDAVPTAPQTAAGATSDARRRQAPQRAGWATGR